jgi:hypothetical protein
VRDGLGDVLAAGVAGPQRRQQLVVVVGQRRRTAGQRAELLAELGEFLSELIGDACFAVGSPGRPSATMLARSASVAAADSARATSGVTSGDPGLVMG